MEEYSPEELQSAENEIAVSNDHHDAKWKWQLQSNYETSEGVIYILLNC